MSPDDTTSRLRHAIALEEAGKHRRALDHLYRLVDDILLDSEARCNDLLGSLDETEMGTHLLVGILTVTLPQKDRLPQRSGLVARARSRLAQLAPDRVDRLLAGLE